MNFSLRTAAPGPSAPERYRGPSWPITIPVRRALELLVVIALVAAVAYNLVGLPPWRTLGLHYRLDLDVYRIGGRAVVDGLDLYGVLPTTFYDIGLPFTYPPTAALAFAPMALISLTAASTITTIASLVLLAVTVFVVVGALIDTYRRTRLLVTGAITALGCALEPVYSTLDYGQINIILMSLVVLDTLLRRTPWPRGTLIGLVTAIKLTPAVFVLYFLLRRDYRSAVVSGLSFVVVTAVGFAVTFSDSVTYWTTVIVDSDRIGNPAYISNQSITGMLARLGVDPALRTALWVALSAVALAVAVVGIRAALARNDAVLAVCTTAVLGLLVSPVSWSHHWVWMVPTLAALGYAALTRRSILLGVLTAVGVVVFREAAHWRISTGRWEGLGWPLADQILASSYVWWGALTLGVLAVGSRLGPRSTVVQVT